jgi:gamma-glutamylcyclotransferase (GGCT)/AIG2-like uncharacterized protein YtfP
MAYPAASDLLAVYGTLRRRSVSHKLPVAVSRLRFFGRGLIRGRLFHRLTYPVLIQGPGLAPVELFRITDPSVFFDLDRYEAFEPTNPRASLFIRHRTLLLNPQVWAWAYFLRNSL